MEDTSLSRPCGRRHQALISALDHIIYPHSILEVLYPYGEAAMLYPDFQRFEAEIHAALLRFAETARSDDLIELAVTHPPLCRAIMFHIARWQPTFQVLVLEDVWRVPAN